MPESLSVRLENVSKVYKLHGSQRDQLIEVLRLQRFGIRPKTPGKEFSALRDVSLEVPRGHRIGIVGRNGAGKTTLLKLICGNFAPTTGRVDVNGTVQALMNMGLGFHPEYTGRDNVEASLQYNGLARSEYEEAMHGVIDFCELGDFLDQPFKTYSLGMQARLMFAAATAIRPDILIVDEVLGAGDAYFVAKSKQRVDKLVGSGCTMLLVSHSMQQVLELCDEAIWLDQGQIRMQGESFLVVKAYEQYLHGPIAMITGGVATGSGEAAVEGEVVPDAEAAGLGDAVAAGGGRKSGLPDDVLLQEPRFVPHGEEPNLQAESLDGFRFIAQGGLSRWDAEVGVKLTGFGVVTERGITNTLVAMRPARFLLSLAAERAGVFRLRYGIALHDHLGNCLTRIFSPCDQFDAVAGQQRTAEILLNPCQVGPGDYTLGISVLDYGPIEQLNSTRRYDLLSRSFAVRVELPESMGAIAGSFFHSAEWRFSAQQTGRAA